MIRRIIIALIVIAIAVGGWYAWTQYNQKQAADAITNLQTVAAERGNLTATIGATGIVRSDQTAILTWQTTGTIEQIDIEAGDQVSADQVLASLQKTSLPQNIIMAEIELNNAQKSLDDLKKAAETAKIQSMQLITQYAQAVRAAQYQLDNYTVPAILADLEVIEAIDVMEEKLDQARDAFEPYKYLSSGNSTRQSLKEDLDQAQSDYNAAVKRLDYVYNLDVAKANLENARQDYEKWKDGPDPIDIANAESRIDAAQATINLTRLAAPFDAIITDVQVKPGDQVAPGAIAFRLDDLSRLLVDVLVSEVDINRIQIGQNATFSFDAILGTEYTGRVVDVAQVGSTTQGVVDFKVIIELIDSDEEVKPGMTAAVNIIVNELEDVLLIPNRAVRIKDGQRVVYVLRADKPQSVDITLGASSDIYSEVVNGNLEAGDKIILNPPIEFEPGEPPPFAR